MANIRVKNAQGEDVYLAATGAGTDGDPHVPTQAVTEINSGNILTLLQAVVAALAGTLTVDGAVTVDQTGIINALSALLAELQDKADVDQTQPVSVGAALPAGTNNIGDVDIATMPAVSAATVTLSTTAAAHAASGDNTVITAPGSGQRLVISSIVVQNESATATTVLLKDGSTAKRRALLQNQGDGVAWTFAPGHEWRLGNNAALVLNLSGANSHGVTVDYRVEAV